MITPNRSDSVTTSYGWPIKINYLLIILTGLLCFFTLACGPKGKSVDPFEKKRRAMVREIEAEVLETSLYLGKKNLDPRVMEALARVPRHEFVLPGQRRHAYENRPLPIGHGQTISQPYIVAIMTDLLEVKPTDRVLEVGTGSGYQAAILSELAANVYTIEIIKPLGQKAKNKLQSPEYDNVKIRIEDGYYGWKENAPYDAIIVTAASSHVPPPLIGQLKEGGRMIIPVGSRFLTQQLLLIKKDAKGKIFTRQVLPVRFVPLTGDHE
jgi:protein-L-isoaspartate(D-aspartate) O-methyltransferase